MKNNMIAKNFLIYGTLFTRLVIYGGIVLTPSHPAFAIRPCEIDVACADGNIRRAVAHYSIKDDNRPENSCSGTLLNNTDYSNNQIHYFLTAYHCLNSVDGLQTALNCENLYTTPACQALNSKPKIVFHWNFQQSNCSSPQVMETPTNTMEKVEIVASSQQSDFLLLKLNLQGLANPYHAGWDTTVWMANGSVATPPLPVKGIHHPLSNVKKKSTSINVTTGAPNTNLPNFWQVDWGSGVTELGSSGSCLFEPSNNRCIGQLWGGDRLCPGELTDGVSTVYYGKFSTSWNGNNTNNTQLKFWLDPLGIINQSNTQIFGINGDPHITTTNNKHYDFQGAGEYVVLRDRNGLEIQTRQAPIATTFTPGPDPYDGLATCVSLNTAVAARVGKHRVTYQPQSNFDRKTVNLQLRIDGKLTTINQEGLSLEGGGRIEKINASGGLKIDFPDETVLRITPGFWDSQQAWYMNVEAIRPAALDGIGSDVPEYGNDYAYHRKTLPVREGGLMAAIPQGSWLPELPNGRNLGPMPESLNERFEQLYHQFGEAWRVNSETTLFDYAEGTSTKTYTNRDWPQLNGNCQAPNMVAIPEPKPELIPKLKEACAGILKQDKGNTYRDCLFDVLTTGNTGFAKTYEETLSIRPGATKTALSFIPKILFLAGDVIPVTATVTKTVVSNAINPTGTVQVLLDGVAVGAPAKLDPNGITTLNVSIGLFGRHTISANYSPSPDTGFLSSQSPLQSVTIISYWLLLYLLLGILILVVGVWMWKRFR